MTERVVVCKSCDLAVKVDDDDTENFGICPRCGQRVKEKALTAESDVAVMAISALIFLCISIVEPFMSLNSHGIEASMNLFSIVCSCKCSLFNCPFRFFQKLDPKL